MWKHWSRTPKTHENTVPEHLKRLAAPSLGYQNMHILNCGPVRCCWFAVCHLSLICRHFVATLIDILLRTLLAEPTFLCCRVMNPSPAPPSYSSIVSNPPPPYEAVTSPPDVDVMIDHLDSTLINVSTQIFYKNIVFWAQARYSY